MTRSRDDDDDEDGGDDEDDDGDEDLDHISTRRYEKWSLVTKVTLLLFCYQKPKFPPGTFPSATLLRFKSHKWRGKKKTRKDVVIDSFYNSSSGRRPEADGL